MNRYVLQFLPVTVRNGNMSGCLSDIFVDEFVTVIQCAPQYEMNMCVHQDEGQDDYVIFLQQDKDSVHPVDEIFFVIEHKVYCVSVSAKMPAVFYRYVLTF